MLHLKQFCFLSLLLVAAQIAKSDTENEDAQRISRGLYMLNQNNDLYKVNEVTANKTLIKSSVLPAEIVTGGYDIDTNRGILYVIGFNVNTYNNTHLYGIHVSTGHLVSNITVNDFLGAEFVGASQYVAVDPTNGDLYITGLISVAGNHSMYKIDHRRKEVSYIASFVGGDFAGTQCCFDPFYRVIWFEFIVNTTWVVEGIDVRTGKIFNSVPDTVDLESLNYDPKRKLIVGFGLVIKNESQQRYELIRSLVYFNGSAGTFNVTKVFPESFPSIMASGISTIDPVHRKLFGSFSYANDTTLFASYLGTVDIDTGSVSYPLICSNFVNCPTLLAYQP